MSFINLTKVAEPSTPSASTNELYVDTADNRTKQKDANGVVSTFNNDGLMERNVITNGGFLVQQRVATASTAIAGVSTTTRGGVVSDCWSVTSSVASNLAWAQIDTSGAAESGLYSRFYGSAIASSAGKKVMLSQWILNSDMNHLRGRKVRFSIKHSQKVGSEGQTWKLGLIQLTSSGTVDTSPAFLSGAWSASTGVDPSWGTNLSAITPDSSPTPENGTVSGSFVTFTTTLAWKTISGVWTVPTNCKNLVVVCFADATGGTTDNVSFAEAQLTMGPEIVEYLEPPFAETVYRCQRRFCKSFPLTVVPAVSVTEANGGSGACGMIGKAGATALAANFPIQFPVRMWKTPTITYFTPTSTGAQCWRFSGAAAAAQTATATRTNSLTDRGLVVTATGDAAGAVGDLVAVHYTADAEIVA
jgi:hypothetical protein